MANHPQRSIFNRLGIALVQCRDSAYDCDLNEGGPNTEASFGDVLDALHAAGRLYVRVRTSPRQTWRAYYVRVGNHLRPLYFRRGYFEAPGVWSGPHGYLCAPASQAIPLTGVKEPLGGWSTDVIERPEESHAA